MTHNVGDRDVGDRDVRDQGVKDRVIGVLALQGAYDAHIRHLEVLGLRTRKIREPQDLRELDGLVLPGGESSTMLNLIERRGLAEPLLELIDRGAPVLATCAGLILLAETAYTDHSRRDEQTSFKRLSVTVERNGWGRQIASGLKSVKLKTPLGERETMKMMFIRAPKIIAKQSDVEVIGAVEGEPVWVRQGAIHAMCGHPELGGDSSVHRLCFL